MLSRRLFIQGGLSAAALGWAPWARRSLGFHAAGCPDTGALAVGSTRPVLTLPVSPASVRVAGVPFYPWFTGDDFANDNSIPFHSCENCFPDGEPPPPTEEVEVAVVGGGLSGLASAYLLREFNPVLFELRPRFGGNALGEQWSRVPFSLGSAYVITPDRGSFLERLYTELGLADIVKVDTGSFEVELSNRIISEFIARGATTELEAAAFARYAQVVTSYTERYPEIPLPLDKDNQWILDLDAVTLRQDIEAKVGSRLPTVLANAVQAYCYSSFGVGWDEISAASGWNFLAAEEFGRWVFPGGNSAMADAFWRALVHHERGEGLCPGTMLRAGCNVVDVRLIAGDRVQITYRDSTGALRSLAARRAILAGSKHICKHILHDLVALDEQKSLAIENVNTVAYVVANVLLTKPIDLEFYDIFLLGDGRFPMDANQFEQDSRVVDALDGGFALEGRDRSSTVLTLYWPLPWHTARFTLITPDAWDNYAQSLAEQLPSILGLFRLGVQDVAQVRMSRWGHAMPIASPGLIANGSVDALRRPIEHRIFFVNQDNWALPAVENSLLDAEYYAAQVAKSLR
jgi:phytoene dehydrogenase-like protein